jgi:hypothetical protein
MADPNRMVTVVEVDDSAEEQAALRHRKRVAAMRTEAEEAARGQTRAWTTTHERLQGLADRTADRHEASMGRIRRAAKATEEAIGGVGRAAERAIERTAALVTAVGVLSGAVRNSFRDLAAGSVVVGAHVVSTERLLNLYRVARIAMSPTLLTAGTLLGGMAIEGSIGVARAQARENQASALVAAQSGRSFDQSYAWRSAGRMGGADYSVFAGRSTSDVRRLSSEFEGLHDPMARARFAVDRFGEGAAQALPLLGERLRLNTTRADELAKMMDGPTRAALEHLDEVAKRPALAMRELGDSMRYAAQEAKGWVAVGVAGVMKSWEGAEAAGAASRANMRAAGVDLEATGSPIGGGVNWQYRQDQQALFSGVLTAGRNKVSAMRPGAPGVSAGVVAASTAAAARYDATPEGLARRLSAEQALLQQDRQRLASAAGTPFEESLRLSVLQRERAVEGLIPQVEAAQHAESRRKQLAEQVPRFVEGLQDANRRGPAMVGNSLVWRSPYEQELGQASAAMFGRQTEFFQASHPFDPNWDNGPTAMWSRYVAGAQNSALRGWLRGQRGSNVESIPGEMTEFAAGRRLSAERAIDVGGRGERLQEALVQLRTGPGGERAAIQETYQLRIKYAKEVYALEREYVDEETRGFRLRAASDEAEIDRVRQIGELRRRQFDDTKHSIAGLIDAGLSRPGSLPGALLGMGRNLLLAPVKEGLAAAGARWLNPLLHGRGEAAGSGGLFGAIGGWFGGGRGAVVEPSRPDSSAGGAAGSVMGAGGMVMAGPIGAAAMQMMGLDATAGPTASRARASVLERVLRGSSGHGGLRGAWSSATGGLKDFAGFGHVTRDANGTPWATVGNRSIDVSTVGGKLSALGHSPAAGVLGTMLATDGLRRGGALGLAEDTAGGAALGFLYGGPLGAAIGAGAGLLGGVIRLFVHGKQEQMRALIRNLYGVDVASKGVVKQLVDIADQQYGGSISVAARSSTVRDLVRLYAESTGQRSGTLDALQVHSASLAQSGGRLYQQATYANGLPYTFASGLSTLGPGGATVPTASPYAGMAVIQLSAPQTVDLWRTGTTQAIAGNPRGVAEAATRGARGSDSRSGFAGLLAPGYVSA